MYRGLASTNMYSALNGAPNQVGRSRSGWPRFQDEFACVVTTHVEVPEHSTSARSDDGGSDNLAVNTGQEQHHESGGGDAEETVVEQGMQKGQVGGLGVGQP